MPILRRGSHAALVALATSCLAASAGAQAAVTIVPIPEIDASLRFLSSDLLEGRAPATRGGALTEAYIAAQLESYGVRPGADGSYFQKVPIDVVTADPATIHVTVSGKASATLHATDDVVVWAGSATPESHARGEVVFVGYGARAPEYRWDDFKGMDLKGKILLVLVNDPPATAAEPNLFGGKAMTYYGRWTYKYEEAERQGAAGMLIIHTTEGASYPWQVVVGSNSTEHRLLPRPSSAPPPIGVRGWIQHDVAAKMLSQAGLDLTQLVRDADTREFRPVSTGIEMDMSFTNHVAHMSASNVVGVIRGSDPKLAGQYVLYSAHHDHLGIGPAVNGDSIYNGAYDNASGVSAILAVAHAASRAQTKPSRSQLFVFVTGEESGLLGSQYFGEHPPVPARDIVAALNVDEANPLGLVRDLNVLGDDKSSLGPALAEMIKPEGMRISPDAQPQAGHFYRSDHFSFARVGIPSVSIGAGNDFVGKPAGWGKAHEEEYTSKHYHQPSDEYDPHWPLTGTAQIAGIVYRFGTRLADSRAIPVWDTNAEFRAVREQSLRAR
ncbi:MAG: M28 family peptidase [Gemmatimonadota bacterium]|nr:M28 family peptidase [Gemmatimonadota bacterium]